MRRVNVVGLILLLAGLAGMGYSVWRPAHSDSWIGHLPILLFALLAVLGAFLCDRDGVTAFLRSIPLPGFLKRNGGAQ